MVRRMPKTEVVFYAEVNGTIPIIDWLDGLTQKPRTKCLARMKRLEELGHELRRPEADYLRDGIYELRIGLQGVNYRILYFFHQQVAAVVSHGFTKERMVPSHEIDAAIKRMKNFKANPKRHTFKPGGI